MSKMILIEEATVKLALEALEHCNKHGCVPKQQALDKMAENARELGLDYEPAQPYGWKLVPLEPTQEMIDAVPTKPHPTRPNGWGDRNVAIYKAMIAAAPQPAQKEPVAIALNTGTKQGVKWLKNIEHGEHLYTSPPAQRTWVGLTDEESTVIWANSQSVDEAIRATEKQLMENNI